jgi:hypothetical protein
MNIGLAIAGIPYVPKRETLSVFAFIFCKDC